MPGFFDIIFRQPEPPKPKKAKKTKKTKKTKKLSMRKEDSVIDSLRAEIAELRGTVTQPELKPEPEPEVEDEPDVDA